MPVLVLCFKRKVMEKNYCWIHHQSPEGGSCSELLAGRYAAEVHFRACRDSSAIY